MKVYFDFNDWWVGYYRGPNQHYVCVLPTLVVTWGRKLERKMCKVDGKVPAVRGSDYCSVHGGRVP